MGSEMFVFDDTNYYPTDEISGSNFFTDPLSDSSIDSFLQEISDDKNPHETLDQITQNLFSDFGNLSNLENVYNYSTIPEVKTEDFHLGFDNNHSNNSNYFTNGGESDDNLLKFMQRSFSSNSFDGKNPSFLPQQQQPPTRFDHTLMDDQSSLIRRVCSTGDLPKVVVKNQTCTTQQTICSSSPLSGEGSNFIEDGNFKVGRYSAEERKERIDRYKAKRTQRNFNKTIKYACRKTLADNRPRIRGRFARNDETGEIPKPTSFNRYEDDDDLWVDNLQEENEQALGRRGGGRLMSNFGATQFQYCGY